MPQQAQSFEKHAKLVPGFHVVASLLLLVFTIWTVMRVFQTPSFDTVALLCAMLTLHLLGFYSRSFATKNQDRIIRLEERLRMRELLPAELRSKINDFTTKQLVALRFASDEELPELAAKVINENIVDAKKIKSMVKHWRADHHRV